MLNSRISLALWVFLLTFGSIARGQSSVVSTEAELRDAVASANSAASGYEILLTDGLYKLTDTLYVTGSNVRISSVSGDRERVVLQGDAMSGSARVKNLIRVTGENFEISDLTLQKSGWHLLQIAGENNADNPVIRNIIFRDAYEQMFKVSIDQADYSVTSDNGVIEDSLFEYTQGIGPQFYIGGIDVHGGKNWVVRRNVFRNIISPSQEVAEFAIHFWNQTADVLIEKNQIINCDRGIGLGLDNRGNLRGVIKNNMIYHAANRGSFADVGIYLEQSPGTLVINNTVIGEHAYPRSIEYRFAETTDVFIANNLTNRPIAARNGATGTVSSNIESASLSWFVDPENGDLHLSNAIGAVVDSGLSLSDIDDDFDSRPRPQGNAIDVGAHEWAVDVTVRPKPPLDLKAM